MLSLFRCKVILLALLIGFGATAQVKTKHMPNYDAKPIRFGYYIGFAESHLKVKHLPSFNTAANLENNKPHEGPVYSVTSPSSSVIRAGAMVNIFINDYFDIRFSPLNISVLERKITYVDASNEEQKDNLTGKAWMEFPFHVKYKSERRGNSRMYLFAGGRMGFETNIRSRRGASTTFSNKSLRTSDLMIEYGVGLEFFREYFKVTPELHFSHGVLNMIPKKHDKYYLDHIKNMKSHNVSFLVFFQ